MVTKKTTEPTFEVALAELEAIVQQLEKGELPLEKALTAFQKGISLSRYCQDSLEKAEQTVAKMMTQQGEIELDGETNE
ncbi:exodeoxyribonuclease VII small subunit [Vaginisenegalia massiliensis]|uniref:exodeoxyribonuclease VII small subunit n=1 Tax=Vaginisenegalia massiliensis TaxID=2058294 RepID=UPI000F528668|nr:exodeoxyribonuclease VII small subunit [Vaginisenegalia massiliensis]